MLIQAYADIVRTARTLANARGGKACGDGFIAGDLKCHAGAGNMGEIGKIPKFGRKHYAKVGGRLQRVADVEKPNPMSAEWPPRRALPGRPDTAPPPQAARQAVQRPPQGMAERDRVFQAAVQRDALAAREREARLLAERAANVLQAEADRRAAAQPPPADQLRGQAAIIARQAAAQHLPAAPQGAAPNPPSAVQAVPAPPPAPVIRPQARAPIGKAGIAAINQAIQRNDLAAVRGVNLNGAAPRIKRWQQDVIAHMERQAAPVAPVAQAAPAVAVSHAAAPPATAAYTPLEAGANLKFKTSAEALGKAIASSPQISVTANKDRGISESSVIKFRDAGGVKRAIFKPISGERHGAARNVNDSTYPAAHRELAAAETAAHLGVSMPSVASVSVNGKPGTAMEFVDHDKATKTEMSLWNKDSARAAELGVFDYVIGNYDRHGGNFIIDRQGVLQPIDHGLSFPEKGKDGVQIGGHNKPAFISLSQARANGPAFQRVASMVAQMRDPEFNRWIDDMVVRRGLSADSAVTMKSRVSDVVSVFDANKGRVGGEKLFFKSLRAKGWTI